MLWDHKRNRARTLIAADAVNTIYHQNLDISMIDSCRLVTTKEQDRDVHTPHQQSQYHARYVPIIFLKWALLIFKKAGSRSWIHPYWRPPIVRSDNKCAYYKICFIHLGISPENHNPLWRHVCVRCLQSYIPMYEHTTGRASSTLAASLTCKGLLLTRMTTGSVLHVTTLMHEEELFPCMLHCMCTACYTACACTGLNTEDKQKKTRRISHQRTYAGHLGTNLGARGTQGNMACFPKVHAPNLWKPLLLFRSLEGHLSSLLWRISGGRWQTSHQRCSSWLLHLSTWFFFWLNHSFTLIDDTLSSAMLGWTQNTAITDHINKN